jgi:threonine dehydrogenase-like Zn-dependent dehydrogenase
MKAVVLQPGKQFAIVDVPEPRILKSGDIIVKVTRATICGSDIHIKHGVLPGIPPGTVIGHEFVGVVEEAGADVVRFKPGDRVAVAPITWCGYCAECKRREVQHCLNGGVWAGGEFFGKGLSGAQTSYIRVPYADNCAMPIPDNVADDEAVFVGDIFVTGYTAAYEGHIKTGDRVVIFGCGPIGLGALLGAWQFGPRQVISVDMLDNRLAQAKDYGATVIDARAGNVLEQIREATRGVGADVAIEAIGTSQTFLQALKAVRRGGTVSVVGLFPDPVEFPIQELVYYGIKMFMGLGNPIHMGRLMALVESGRVTLAQLATHT